MRRLINIATVVTALAVAIAAPALADKGGNPNGGNGNGGGNSNGASNGSPTLAASCNPCSAGAVVEFTGSGYDTSEATALVNISYGWTTTGVNEDGTISFSWPFNNSGSYFVQTYQHRGNNLVLMAEVNLVIE